MDELFIVENLNSSNERKSRFVVHMLKYKKIWFLFMQI